MVVRHRHQTLAAGVSELTGDYLIQVTDSLVHVAPLSSVNGLARPLRTAGLVIVQIAILRAVHQWPAVFGGLEQQSHCQSLHQWRLIDEFPTAVHFRGRVVLLGARRGHQDVSIAEAITPIIVIRRACPAVVHGLTEAAVIVIDKVLTGDGTAAAIVGVVVDKVLVVEGIRVEEVGRSGVSSSSRRRL